MQGVQIFVLGSWAYLGLFAQLGELEPLLERFTEEEEKQMKRMLQRMDVLAKVMSHILTSFCDKFTTKTIICINDEKSAFPDGNITSSFLLFTSFIVVKR